MKDSTVKDLLRLTDSDMKALKINERIKPVGKDVENDMKKCWNTFYYFTTKNENEYVCAECGKKFFGKKKNGSVKCPHCHKTLTRRQKYCNGIVVEDNKMFKEKMYYGITQVHEDVQIFRMFLVAKTHRRGFLPTYWNNEVFRNFYDTKYNKWTIISRPLPMFGYRNDSWCHGQPFKLYHRTSGNRFSFDPIRWNIKRIHPALEKIGFDGEYHGLLYSTVINRLVDEPHFETLWKAKLYNLSQLSESQIRENWNELKICIRNKYDIISTYRGAGNWVDYIDLLKFFNKDTRNAFYVCPKDLNKAHDKYVEMKNAYNSKKRFETLKDEIELASKEYKKSKSKYLNIAFRNDKIQVKVLKDVAEFYDEGEKMHHCVFTNNYYNKKDSIILSARNNNNQRIATIEWDTKRKDILQIRGKCNKTPEELNEIKNLIEQNKKLFNGKSK